MIDRVPASMAGRLAAAADVFAEQGFEAARIEDIAKATGIPRATLYYHFRSKENVLSFLLRSMLNDVGEAVAAAVAPVGSAETRLRRAIAALLEVMAASPSVARLLVGNFTGAGALADVALAVRTSFHEPVTQILHDGCADGTLRSVDLDRTTSAIFGAVVVTGLRDIVLLGELEPTSTSDAVSALVLHGIAEPKGSRP